MHAASVSERDRMPRRCSSPLGLHGMVLPTLCLRIGSLFAEYGVEPGCLGRIHEPLLLSPVPTKNSAVGSMTGAGTIGIVAGSTVLVCSGGRIACRCAASKLADVYNLIVAPAPNVITITTAIGSSSRLIEASCLRDNEFSLLPMNFIKPQSRDIRDAHRQVASPAVRPQCSAEGCCLEQ
jgi:hypothetical protein